MDPIFTMAAPNLLAHTPHHPRRQSLVGAQDPQIAHQLDLVVGVVQVGRCQDVERDGGTRRRAVLEGAPLLQEHGESGVHGRVLLVGGVEGVETADDEGAVDGAEGVERAFYPFSIRTTTQTSFLIC
ncbi:hypothetical protein Taro_051511 [Colocasia esculenta]|uniref:Uncharacterized protein n=1 Tax=Colocasia esculenta TaxID=4460 RepID=A0A843XHG4_COLES|nr:hypothetical protein [Colocasia esculenta]